MLLANLNTIHIHSSPFLQRSSTACLPLGPLDTFGVKQRLLSDLCTSTVVRDNLRVRYLKTKLLTKRKNSD